MERIVEVIWTEVTTKRVKTVGYVIHDNRDEIVLTGSLGNLSVATITIPRSLIITTTELREKGT